jgi:hypothetical protein
MFHYICEILDVSIEYDLKLMSEQLKLQKYSDSDWSKDINLRKLMLEYVFQLINKSVFEVQNVKKSSFYHFAKSNI